MTNASNVVRNDADILPAYRDTPVGQLLRYHNLGLAPTVHRQPEILVATCLDARRRLLVPEGFAINVTAAAAGLKRMPFKVSWAVGIAGVSALALVGHEGCGMVTLAGQREEFLNRLVAAGWERTAAEQHFDHWSDLFAIEEPAAFVRSEAARLRHRYPRLLVAPLLQDAATGLLSQLEA